jgi:shikimate dehydrogenase
MGVPYAEVIGDPIAHSKSPSIHKFWLDKLGLRGRYETVRLNSDGLPAYLQARRTDIWWRGCNVTAPLKERAAGLVGSPAGLRQLVGAVNCIARTPLGCLHGTNTDVAGVAEALQSAKLDGAIVCLIGSGGAARSVLCHLRGKSVGLVRILARSPEKAERLASGFEGRVETMKVEEAAKALSSATVLVNATPLGMTGQPPMLSGVIEGLSGMPRDAIIFDTVYAPLETALLGRAREIGLQTVDGLSMLIGQAAPAFEIFFGAPAPREHDAELRDRLVR